MVCKHGFTFVSLAGIHTVYPENHIAPIVLYGQMKEDLGSRVRSHEMVIKAHVICRYFVCSILGRCVWKESNDYVISCAGLTRLNSILF